MAELLADAPKDLAVILKSSMNRFIPSVPADVSP